MIDERSVSKSHLTSYDALYIFILTSISLAIRLWVIYHPDGPAFDEVHFGNFTNWYTKSQFFFDIHPTLGKLLMFGFANLSEYDGNLGFHSTRHYSSCSYISLRVTPAIFSALCCPLIYLTLRFTGFGYLSAITASILLITDTSLATEGRFILSDGILHFFCCLHFAIICYTFSIYDCNYYIYLKQIDNSNKNVNMNHNTTEIEDDFDTVNIDFDLINIYDADVSIKERKFSKNNNKLRQKRIISINQTNCKTEMKFNRARFNFFHILTGISLGAACSVKNTAWGLMVFDAYIYIVGFLPLLNFSIFDYLFDVFIYGVSLFLIMISVYIISFFIHFIVLPFAGQGTGYLPEDMKKQLIPNQQVNCSLWFKRIAGPSLLYKTFKVSLIMHNGNMGIKSFHMSQSRPNNWPLLTGIDVGFWGGDGQEIRCHGNVFSYYFAFIGVILCTFPSFLKEKMKFNKDLRKNNEKEQQKLDKINFLNSLHDYLVELRFTIGWLASYLPFYLIPRTLFLYHYLIPLMIGCCAFGASLEILIKSKRIRGTIAFATWILAFFGFWLWMPLVYGKYMHERDIMIWNQNWISGDKQYKIEQKSDRLKPK
ncbi:hypothetical protein M9Y10_001715 [Tritrichomonas musculus]|uniref:Dolichyl-phosphate-mannose--protein mannosyltransferase n=1 Tax=Tritrichomonas musculus TaxID=1915356 RepID=A0ABR2L7Q2_9EUKA